MSLYTTITLFRYTITIQYSYSRFSQNNHEEVYFWAPLVLVDATAQNQLCPKSVGVTANFSTINLLAASNWTNSPSHNFPPKCLGALSENWMGGWVHTAWWMSHRSIHWKHPTHPLRPTYRIQSVHQYRRPEPTTSKISEETTIHQGDERCS